MFTNPFERKHSVLRQALDRVMKGEMRLSFRRKNELAKTGSGSSVTGSNSSVASSSSTPKFNPKR